MSDDPQLQRIYALIGKIATSWSEVELLWYLIFATIMRCPSAQQIDAIFFQWDTSAKQRDLVMSVADATYPTIAGRKPHRLRRRIGQLYAKTNDAAGDRNAAIHAVVREEASLAALLIGTKHYTAERGLNPKKPNKLAGRKLEQELERTVTTIDQIRAEIAGFLGTISQASAAPLGLLAGFRKQGFPPPNWIYASPAAPADQKASGSLLPPPRT